MIRFFAAGIPKSMRVGGIVRFERRGKVHMAPKRAASEWAAVVGEIGRKAWEKPPLAGGLDFTAIFYLPRPASAKKSERLPLKRPDLENLTNKMTDQFNGVFYLDDSQITDQHIYKRFATDRPDRRTGVEIIVKPVHLADVVVPQQPSLITAPA